MLRSRRILGLAPLTGALFGVHSTAAPRMQSSSTGSDAETATTTTARLAALEARATALEARTTLATPTDVLAYWFAGDAAAQRRRHWYGLPEVDAEIRQRFGATWAALAAEESPLARQWAAGGMHSILALIIVWDQFSRQLWRGDGRSFACDGRAGALAMATVRACGNDLAAAGLGEYEAVFLKMPLQHSEDLAVQRLNAQLCLAADASEAREHVAGHLAVIERFGRYPKRNAALGRQSTPEELAYLGSDEAKGRAY